MWILFAFSGPVLWAASTHIDKYLVEKYFKNSSTTVLMVFTALIGVIMLPFIWWFYPSVIHLSALSIAVMIASGLMYMFAMLFYLQAIQSEEASVVAPMFQATVIFGYVLAYFLLGEHLTKIQLLASLLIVSGALLLSVRPRHKNKKKIQSRLVFSMLVCTFILALSSVIFKYFAVSDDFWPTTFWTFVGEALFGIGILLIPRYWKQFINLLKVNTGPLLSINGANELINLGGGLGTRFALLFAPVVIVQAISGTTTIFTFLFGILVTAFFPVLGREDIDRKNLIIKGAAALLITIGVILAGGGY